MKLRRDRGLSARALSMKLGLAESYLHKWEHDAGRRVSREVLARVAEVLELGDPQRRELFRLADARDVPEHARHLYDSPNRFLQNIDQAIRSVDHPAECEELPSSEWETFIEAVAWTLAHRATENDTPETWLADRILWPPVVYRHGIRTENPDWIGDRPRIDVAHLFERHFPVAPDAELTPEAITAIGSGMAAVWCAWTCESIDRCLELVKAIRRWSVRSTPDLGPVATLTFATTADQEAYGATGIACSAITRAHSGAIAQELYEDANLHKVGEPGRHYVHALRPIDAVVPGAFQAAFYYMNLNARSPMKASVLRSIETALYLVCSDLWHSGIEPALYATGMLGAREGTYLFDRLEGFDTVDGALDLLRGGAFLFLSPDEPIPRAKRYILGRIRTGLRAQFESMLRAALAAMYAASASVTTDDTEAPESRPSTGPRRSGAKKSARKDRKKRRKGK